MLLLKRPARWLVLLAGLIALATPLHAVDVGTAFTYQGSLSDGAVFPTGPYDFRFTLFDAASGGSTVGVVTRDDVPVSSGVFAVSLDFGSVFFGAARWMQVEVR